MNLVILDCDYEAFERGARVILGRGHADGYAAVLAIDDVGPHYRPYRSPHVRRITEEDVFLAQLARMRCPPTPERAAVLALNEQGSGVQDYRVTSTTRRGRLEIQLVKRRRDAPALNVKSIARQVYLATEKRVHVRMG